MNAGASRRPLEGVFGGTFDPVHYGHLRSAVELVEHMDLAQLRLMPCARPAHRDDPHCSAQHRAAMVALAVEEEARLLCDTRELKRPGTSYMIDSLAELRSELGAEVGLCMVLGCDAVLGITRWHRWTELLDLAHIIIIARPGWALPDRGEVANWLQQHRLDNREALHQRPAGGIVIEELRPLAISSTEIRHLFEAGQSARYLLPQSVLTYIETHGLYRNAQDHAEQEPTQ